MDKWKLESINKKKAKAGKNIFIDRYPSNPYPIEIQNLIEKNMAIFDLRSCLIPGAEDDVLVVSGASSRKTPVEKISV